MSEFTKPGGICFEFGDEAPAEALSSFLCRVAGFLQEVDPFAKLKRYDDWWEHDGLHFYRKQIDFDAVFEMVNSPKHLLESTPDDEFVFVGIAPENSSWYLRYRVEWNYDETSLVGRAAIILPSHCASRFREMNLSDVASYLSERDAHSFYPETIE
jgi:hypothetical protein